MSAAVDAVVRELATERFELGRHDCLTFAARVVAAAHGYDPAAGLAGMSARERRAWRRRDVAGAMAVVAATFGWRRINPATQCEGAVGVADAAGRQTIMVCDGRAWLAPAPRGLCIAVTPLFRPFIAWDTAPWTT